MRMWNAECGGRCLRIPHSEFRIPHFSSVKPHNLVARHQQPRSRAGVIDQPLDLDQPAELAAGRLAIDHFERHESHTAWPAGADEPAVPERRSTGAAPSGPRGRRRRRLRPRPPSSRPLRAPRPMRTCGSYRIRSAMCRLNGGSSSIRIAACSGPAQPRHLRLRPAEEGVAEGFEEVHGVGSGFGGSGFSRRARLASRRTDELALVDRVVGISWDHVWSRLRTRLIDRCAFRHGSARRPQNSSRPGVVVAFADVGHAEPAGGDLVERRAGRRRTAAASAPGTAAPRRVDSQYAAIAALASRHQALAARSASS